MPIDQTTTNFEGKDMSERDLRGYQLAYHRCMRANFTSADLRGANFVGADCTGAIFEDANLDGADFTNATVTPAQLMEARSCVGTIGPSGQIARPEPESDQSDLLMDDEQERPTRRRRASNGEGK